MTKSLLDHLDKNPVALPEEVVSVSEWGRDVTLRGFTSRERDLFEADNLRRSNANAGNGARKRGASVATADLTNFRARLVSRSIVEDGIRTCWNDRGEELLGNQPATVLDRLFTVAQRLHGMSDADVEELSGNSGATGVEGSSSDSRSDSDAPSLN